MSGLKKSPYFSAKESDSDKKVSSASVVSSSTPDKSIKKRPNSSREPISTKRTCSRYFERDNTKFKRNVTTKSDCTITATTDVLNFDAILREFKASRSLLRGVDNTYTATDVPHTAVCGTAQENYDEITCPICLCSVMTNERAAPDSCTHNSFCFSCLVAWGKVINKCPLCKSTFTEVISTSHPQRIERFDVPSNLPSATSDDEGDDDSEGVHVVEVSEIRPLYGYDDSDGFVVGEDVVEYASSGDDNDLLNF